MFYSVLLLSALLAVSAALPTGEVHNRTFVTRALKSRWNTFDHQWPLIPRTKYMEEKPAPYGLKLDDYFKFIPTYQGSVFNNGGKLEFEANCFRNTTMYLEKTSKGYDFIIEVSHKKHLFCNDAYLVGFTGSFDVKVLEFEGKHVTKFDQDYSYAENYDAEKLGFRAFLFPAGIVTDAHQLMETLMLFLGGLLGAHVPKFDERDNHQFLCDHMPNNCMQVRTTNYVNISKSQIKSGDFLGVIRMDGLDPMLAWAMNSHTGHTTITMWKGDVLHVCESTTNSAYWPTNGIQCTEYDTWIQQALKANYNVVHLPLNPEIAAAFDEKTAWEFFQLTQGLPYGFHNLFTGWLDVPEANYPGNLTSNLWMLIMSFGDFLIREELKQGESYDFFAQTMNKRLGTDGLSVNEVYAEMEKRGMKFTELVSMPELDEWLFVDDKGVKGPSMVCDVFVTRMWKAGGIFNKQNLTKEFQATEFTNWDAYSLKIFDANYKRPAECVQADPDSQFCQIMGKYRMTLPGYNTAEPFKNMREKCPSYNRPANC